MDLSKYGIKEYQRNLGYIVKSSQRRIERTKLNKGHEVGSVVVWGRIENDGRMKSGKEI